LTNERPECHGGKLSRNKEVVRAAVPARNVVMPSPRDLGLAALLIGLVLLAYLPAMNGGPVWDDDAHLTRPELASWHGLARIWFELGATAQYYPLLHSAFWLERHLWADAVLGYHLTNVLLHGASALLLLMILRRLELPGAWLAAFLFALHPVHVESVAWMTEQKNTLSLLFYLAAALAYIEFDSTQRRSHYLVATGLFIAALLTKSVTATLPAALLLVIWWRRGRIDWKRDAVPLAPWFVLGISAGLVTAWVERRFVGAEGAAFTLTLADRVLLAGRIPWFYLGKLLWPANLMFVYPRWVLDVRAGYQWLFPVALAALVAALWMLRRRIGTGLLTGFLFFVGTLVPVLGFLNVYPFIFSFVADHFQYEASIGILVCAAWGLTWVARRIAWAPAVVVAILATLTWSHSGVFKNAETLYRDTLARNPDSWLAQSNLGWVLGMEGRTPEAIERLETAVRLNPSIAQVHMNLGVLLARTPERREEGIAQFREALRIQPENAMAHNNLGGALAQTPGRMPEAIAEYQVALRINPDLPDAHFNLGMAYSETGRTPEAIREFEAALRVMPDSPEIHAGLGTELAKVPGRERKAIENLQFAVSRRPDMAVEQELLRKLAAAQRGTAR
jgi:Flp pilus assembly protein TadD